MTDVRKALIVPGLAILFTGSVVFHFIGRR